MIDPTMLLFLLITLLIQSAPTFKAQQAKDDQFMNSVDNGPPEVLARCSWYCAAPIPKASASSNLKPINSIIYGPSNAHDFDITTAWIEGNVGNGKGEFLDYTFTLDSVNWTHYLGITKIIIANGYKKSRTIWEENSRVKKLRLYVNSKTYCYLELIDSFEFQTVEINRIPLPQKGKLKLRFEILEIYPGSKYKDAAISELLFDGDGDH